MEAFAQRYYECNPDIYANSGTMKFTQINCFKLFDFYLIEVCFILSFAIIMLNTSLHNKNARMGGSFTFEKFLHSLNEAISRQLMPDSAIIKVDFMIQKMQSDLIGCL